MYNTSERLRIIDPGLFTQIVCDEIDPYYETQSEAARALRIKQAHYSRLVNGHVGSSITRGLFRELMKCLADKTLQQQLRKAVLSPEARERLYAYRNWLARILRRYGRNLFAALLDGEAEDRDEAASWTGDERSWLMSRQHEWHEMDRRARSLFGLRKTLSSMEPYGQLFSELESSAVGIGGGSARMEVALVRILDPLLASETTAGVERGWNELHDSGELQVYLVAAIKAQQILLNRAPNVQRAQELEAGDAAKQKRRRRKKKGRQ